MGWFDLVVLALAIALLVVATRGWTRRSPAPSFWVQEFLVHVDERGFRPNVLLVRPGVPVRIRFSAGRCGSTVVFPHWGIRRRVGALRKITIDLVAASSGRYKFFGAEDASEGRIVVVAASVRPPAAIAPTPRR